MYLLSVPVSYVYSVLRLKKFTAYLSRHQQTTHQNSHKKALLLDKKLDITCLGWHCMEHDGTDGIWPTMSYAKACAEIWTVFGINCVAKSFRAALLWPFYNDTKRIFCLRDLFQGLEVAGQLSWGTWRPLGDQCTKDSGSQKQFTKTVYNKQKCAD